MGDERAIDVPWGRRCDTREETCSAIRGTHRERVDNAMTYSSCETTAARGREPSKERGRGVISAGGWEDGEDGVVR